ncbi:RtcB family protein [Jiella marina]|uniref:RtcB family protein n=1 Tax=Jiella sp. LLJ827 TaxID=2917712 RepID=UPI0021015DDB|nr:RtcB family protein [Jiella sp. LLJ827]MCQ0987021.1 RtcB family protein [Jiella sp. LLJ827]
MFTDNQSAIRHAIAGGHDVVQVLADGESDRQIARAVADLEAALPEPEALTAADAAIRRIATTPDFHPGKPVPVGVVVDVEGAILPHLVGNDIGCGMRLVVLDGLTRDDIEAAGDLEAHLRHVFFQGGRDLAMTGRDRRAILEAGVPGLIESLESGQPKGLLARQSIADLWHDADRMAEAGVFESKGLEPGFADYGRMDDDHRHDAIMGTIGGGNHFVEIGVVDEIRDGAFANHCGLKAGTVCLVVHSGSLDFGQRVGSTTAEKMAAEPGEGDRRIVSFAHRPALAERYRVGLANATNAAFVNRMTIAMAGIMVMERATGREIHGRLVYDAPHNVAWIDPSGVTRHRKGACPARGSDAMAGTPYAWFGEPVILPGSMGDGTWLLVGTGHAATLESSAHGAGRRLSRGEARLEAVVPGALRVVGPVDFAAPQLAGRRDVLDDAEARLREEAPGAYRPLERVAEPMERAGMARRAARIRPLLTVKG